MTVIEKIDCKDCGSTIEITVNHLLESGNYCENCSCK
jgi:hypothetical protein